MEKLIVSVENEDGVIMSTSSAETTFECLLSKERKPGAVNRIKNHIMQMVAYTVYSMNAGDTSEFIVLAGSKEEMEKIIKVIDVITKLEE